jgi:hypothetical protein
MKKGVVEVTLRLPEDLMTIVRVYEKSSTMKYLQDALADKIRADLDAQVWTTLN